MKVKTSAFSSDEITLTPEDVEALLRGEIVKDGAVTVMMSRNLLTSEYVRDDENGRAGMKNHYFKNGMTVADLKQVLADWPETDGSGEPTEVWLQTVAGLSSIAIELHPLNAGDLLLVPMAEL